MSQERGARALFAAETIGAVQQALDKPLEANRYLFQSAPQVGCQSVDDSAADQGLADRRSCRPVGAILDQVANGDSQVVVRIHQSASGCHDTVAIDIGVICKGDVVAVL